MLFQMSMKTLRENETEDHCSNIVEFASARLGSGGGVRVDATFDKSDGIEGPKSFRSTILAAYVALGTRSTV